jgi:hypothetical protein
VQFFVWCAVERASAHAAPGALWRVNLQTKVFEQLTNVSYDSPASAWATNGTQVAIHSYEGIPLIDLGRREIYPLFLEDGGNGGFDWTEKR